jgi:hypothetical protein
VKIFLVTDEAYHPVTGDLNRARQFLEKLQATTSAPENKIVREALTLAAVVSYCRPFHRSNDANEQSCIWLPQNLVKSLPEKHQRLHKKLWTERNQAWAHTDWKQHEPHLTRINESTSVVVSRNPWTPMDDVEIDEFVSLLDDVGTRVQPRSRIAESQ